MGEKSQSAGGFGVRRRSREMALQLLFQREFHASEEHAPSSTAMLRRFVEDFGVEENVAAYGGEIFLGVCAKQDEIDAIIQGHSAHWKISRMGLVDLSVMRIAVFEMKFIEPGIAPTIAINEAVEIAKRFGSTDSGSFVNGILDQVARGV
jgi:N utilization substance protein B